MAQQSSELFATNMFNLFEELCFIPKNSCNKKSFLLFMFLIANNAANLNLDLNDEIVKGMSVKKFLE